MRLIAIAGLAVAATVALLVYFLVGGNSREPDTVASGGPTEAAPAAQADRAPSDGDGGPSGGGEKKKVKTITIRPDNDTSRKWAEDAQRLGQSSTTTPNQFVGTAQEPKRVTTVPIRPDYGAPGRSERAAPDSRGVGAASPVPPPAGGYVVMVASQRSEVDAQSTYNDLQRQFPAVLGKRAATIARADLGERGVYYRAQVGPFGSAEEAAALCADLKKAGGQCIVQPGQLSDRP